MLNSLYLSQNCIAISNLKKDGEKTKRRLQGGSGEPASVEATADKAVSGEKKKKKRECVESRKRRSARWAAPLRVWGKGGKMFNSIKVYVKLSGYNII
jgi:hypothetical protein